MRLQWRVMLLRTKPFTVSQEDEQGQGSAEGPRRQVSLVYCLADIGIELANMECSLQLQKLSDEIAILRQQVKDLAGSIRGAGVDGSHHALSPNYIRPSAKAQSTAEPREPQFVGPTRSAFSFRIAETSLTRMGFPTDVSVPMSGVGSPAASPRDQTPDVDLQPHSPQPPRDLLQDFALDEVARLLDVFQEEVESVYPFINTKELISNAPHILEYARARQHAMIDSPDSMGVGKKDVHILSIAVATGIVIEAHGNNDLSTKLVDSVELDVCRISRATEVDLQDLQIMTMLVG